MAHLLGHPGCIENLRADLRDLQAAITDVASRTGLPLFRSWKFPEKVSKDLDMKALLELYSYNQDEPQFNQHSHVVLLELLVDRLLLLLQSFTGFAENLLSEEAVRLEQKVGPSMSAGLTTRRFWYSMLKLRTSYLNLLAERKASRNETTPQSTPQAGNPAQQHPKQLLPDILNQKTSTEQLSSSLCPVTAGNAVGSAMPRAAHSKANSTCSTSTQTVKSSLPELPSPLPRPASARSAKLSPASARACDACTTAQASLSEVGKAITSICQKQNIPSALAKFQEELKTEGREGLSAADLSNWASEQSKDLSRIKKHLQMLLKQITTLKEELKQSEKQKRELQKQVKELSQLLQVEKTNLAQQRRRDEESLKMKAKEHLEAVTKLEQDKYNLLRACAEGAVPLLSPEVSKAALVELMKTTTVPKSQALQLEEKVQQLTDQCESLGQELSTARLALKKESAKVESVQRHEESLQAKYHTLRQQLDSLSQEYEELQASLRENEEDKARLEEELKQSREQLQELQLSLEESVVELKAEVSRLEEQERLLVLFPELHAPPHTRIESTGTLGEDMEKQVQANSLRISVLEEENVRLSNALVKLKEAARNGGLNVWLPSSQV
ncbi:CC157 protein, partial [Upupa epops]|nr:CC157 protein [Upupa epops]